MARADEEKSSIGKFFMRIVGMGKETGTCPSAVRETRFEDEKKHKNMQNITAYGSDQGGNTLPSLAL